MEDDPLSINSSPDTSFRSAWRRYVASGGTDDAAGFQILGIFFLALIFPVILAYIAIGDLDATIGTIFIALAIFASLLVQRFAGRHDFAVDILTTALFVSFSAQVYLSGGIYKEPPYWLLAVPMISIGFGFPRRALFWVIATSTLVLVLFLLQLGGHEFPQGGLVTVAKQTEQAFDLVLFVCAAVFAYYLIETSRRRMVARLNLANQELIVARDAAFAAAEAKTQFMNNISHELRTPLNGIIGTTDLLWRGDLTDDQLHLVDILHRSEQSLLVLVNSLLDFAKLEDGKTTLSETSVEPGKILETVAELFAVNAASKRVALVCRVAPDVPGAVLIDSEAMRQILTNLLHNALKWTDEGVVSLHLYCGTPCTDTQANLVWEVRDTGAGISTDRHEAIFTPFEQVDNSLTRRHGGTGLGLAICRRLVELMGAQIEVESSEGQGSCFRITGSVKLVQSAPLDSGRQLAGKTVLVADTVELSYMAVRDAALALGARVVRLSESPTKPVMSPLLDDQTLLVANENALYELDQDTVDDLTSHGCPVVLIAGAGGTPLRPHPNLSIIWAPGNRADLRAALLRWDNTGQTAVNAAKHSYPQFGLNILAAEDNEINQDLLKRIVGKFGCRVDIAGDGVEAVAKWRDTAYDLILMDCQMPHLNGFAATREIRSAERESTRPYTPIVGLTGNAQEESKNNCLDAGMDDYLEKPYRINDLAVVIQRVREPERAT